jgi:hypothetical protein
VDTRQREKGRDMLGDSHSVFSALCAKKRGEWMERKGDGASEGVVMTGNGEGGGC